MKNVLRFFRKITVSISPEVANKIMYLKLIGKKLNLKNPETFNEKINYLKLYVFPNDKNVIQCADKYLVRKYVENKNLSNILVPLIGCWNTPDEINWERLPNKFAMKCNHGCGYNIICNDKSKLDIKKTNKILKKWMKEDFGKVSGELHYSKISRKIICEKFLADDIKDYKFFCFNGEPKFFYISQNVNGDFHNMQADFFYLDGSKTEFERIDHKHFINKPQIPSNIKEMIEISKKLSSEFKFVRVDLFSVDEKIYFSELTFTPCSGFMPISPYEWDKKIGDWIDINKK